MFAILFVTLWLSYNDCFVFCFVNIHYCFSVSGQNKHYDTPSNPGAPGRVPGGSCSGAAVCVASNLVDFSVGELLKYFFSDMKLSHLCIS